MTQWITFVANFSLRVGMLMRENPWPGLRPPQITLGCLHQVQSHRAQATDAIRQKRGVSSDTAAAFIPQKRLLERFGNRNQTLKLFSRT